MVGTGSLKAENGVLPPLTYNLALSGTLLSRGDLCLSLAPVLLACTPLASPLILFFCARTGRVLRVQVTVEQGTPLLHPPRLMKILLQLLCATSLKMLLAET